MKNEERTQEYERDRTLAANRDSCCISHLVICLFCWYICKNYLASSSGIFGGTSWDGLAEALNPSAYAVVFVSFDNLMFVQKAGRISESLLRTGMSRGLAEEDFGLW